MVRSIARSHAALGIGCALALTVALAACGEKKSEAPATPSGRAAPVSVSADSALAAKVPAGVKADGKLVVGTDAGYAPNEYLDTDGKTVIGFDVDLFKAVAAKLGLRTEWQPAKFDDVIPGVQAGKYEVGVSSFTINPERKQRVLMVSYFTAGTQWVARKGTAIDPDSACGKKVAVQTGTVQVDDIAARSRACTSAGKPAIVVDQYQSQGDATAAVVSGKNDAMLADSPICSYAVQQTRGNLALVGKVYDSAPYGYVVSNDQRALAEALRDATKALIADGTYKSIVDRWGAGAGALATDPAINP